MTTTVRALKRASYRDIPLYSTPKERSEVDLSDNTNLWGAPPSALRVLRESPEESVTRYPTAFEPALRSALADYVGVSPDMIVAGCGSDDVLDSAIRAFGEPGEALCLPAPSFSMIPVFARTNGLIPVEVPLTARLDADAAAMLETAAQIIYLCSPNNPTGGAFSRDMVERIVSGAAGLVIIDQAYAEFGGESFTDLVSTRPVLVTRTLSKAFGLAGLRVGYGIGSPALVGEIMKARGPYKVNALAERAAIAALENDKRWVADRAADVVANRERFRQELAALRGTIALASAANFVLVPVEDCFAVSERLRRLGIGVRALPSLSGIGDAVRIGIGPWEMMERCLDALGAEV